MELTETAAVVYRSIVALGSLAVPARFRFGPNDDIPHIIGTGFVVDARGIVMTAGHVARALSSLPRHPETGKHAAMAILFGEREAKNAAAWPRGFVSLVKNPKVDRVEPRESSRYHRSGLISRKDDPDRGIVGGQKCSHRVWVSIDTEIQVLRCKLNRVVIEIDGRV